MKSEKLWKFTGITCIAFGIYSIILAIMIIAFIKEEFSYIFAIFVLIFGIFYIFTGINLLRKGKYGFFIFFGMFGSTFWWGISIPWYFWPMIIMPIVIIVLFVLVFISGNLSNED